MAMTDKLLVLWQFWKTASVISGNPTIHAFKCFVGLCQPVPDEDGE